MALPQPKPTSQPQGNVLDDETLAEIAREIRAYMEERFEKHIKSLPKPAEPVKPVINVMPAVAAPTINVNPASPEITVAAAPPEITVNATAPVVNVAAAPPVITVEGAQISVEPTPVTLDQTQVVRVLTDLTTAYIKNTALMNALVDAVETQNTVLGELAKAMTATKTIVSDANGKPVGLKIG